MGISRQPTRATKITPATAISPPTGVKSNIPNGSSNARDRNVAMMMLGGVPIRVNRPPRIEAKDSGIRIIAGDRLVSAAAWMATGISSASAPTLFMKPDSTAATMQKLPMKTMSLLLRGST